MVICKREGIVDQVDSERIIVRVESDHSGVLSREVGADIYQLIKFKRSNQNTCINQKPIVLRGQRVIKGQVIADGPCTDFGELALGDPRLLEAARGRPIAFPEVSFSSAAENGSSPEKQAEFVRRMRRFLASHDGRTLLFTDVRRFGQAVMLDAGEWFPSSDRERFQDLLDRFAEPHPVLQGDAVEGDRRRVQIVQGLPLEPR